jgi:hypothetical protein
MASSGNPTVNVSLLKRLFGKDFADPMYAASKALNSCRKDTNFGGEGAYVNIALSPQAGVSASFDEALANQSETKEVRFFVTHRKEYVIWSLQNDLIARSMGDKNAVVSAIRYYADKARYAWGRRMAHVFWGNQGGAAGQLDSTTTLTGAVIKLRVRSQMENFEVSRQLQFSTDDGSGTSPAGLRNGGQKLQILKVDRSQTLPQVTVNANLNTVTGLTANDFIFTAGDYSLKMTGLKGWLPATTPTSGDSFFGVDRSQIEPTRQAGFPWAVNGGNKIVGLIDGIAAATEAGVGSEGLSGKYMLFVSPKDWAEFVKDRESLRMADMQGVNSKIGFKALMFESALGEVAIVSEPDVERGIGRLFDTGKVSLRTAGECPGNLLQGGREFEDHPADDAKRARMGTYGNIFHENPGDSVIFSW